MKSAFKLMHYCLVVSLILIISSANAEDNNHNQMQDLITGITWTTHCDNQETYSFVFRGDMSFQVEYIVYHDKPNCQSISLVNIVSGKYQLTGIGTDVAGANKIDLLYSSATMTLYEGFLAEKWKREKVYGYDDWEVGMPKDVLGKSYSPNDTPTFTSIFSIYKVEDNKLYLGKLIGNNDGSTVGKRHNKLDMKRTYYIKEKD